MQHDEQTIIATVSYSRRIVGSLEAEANVSWWSRTDGAAQAFQGWSYGLGLRMRFAGVPHVPGFGGGSIEGFVYSDDEGRGGNPETLPAAVGVEVLLDGGRPAVTDARGRFSFSYAGAGRHRVELVLPRKGGAYFTTPSSVIVDTGGEARFGIAHVPARLSGLVRDDMGMGIPGVKVRLTGDGREAIAATDSSGAYDFAVAAGTYDLTLAPESIPVGYDVTTIVPRRVELIRAMPVGSYFAVIANRSVSGLELQRGGRQVKRREVVVPDCPARLQGIDFEGPAARR